MEFFENLRINRLGLGLTQKELGDTVGVSSVTVGNWERGIKAPGIEHLIKLSEALNISSDSLLGIDSANVLSIEEKSFLAKFNKLDQHGKLLLNTLCDIELRRAENKEKILEFSAESKRYLPYYSAPSAAGFAAPLEGEDFEMLLVDGSVPKDADFAVRISGDSMEPYIHDGDMVYVKECDRIRIGEVGIFCVDGAMYCKQYIPSANFLCLYSTNPERQDANVYISLESSSSVKCCGKVLITEHLYIPEFCE